MLHRRAVLRAFTFAITSALVAHEALSAGARAYKDMALSAGLPSSRGCRVVLDRSA
ncbi:hypothetical protein PF005_g19682 [Phytophthora fragariae]|uniref:RxLR effector protein n=1 Tax=Phytophthora fragariae TaxID=53985 RepID=A0A6A3J925_9STRA|nr:hypothetical protein PF003_g10736 [Phytophthora fragariae]KAE8929257.1 hypothetical protein PF009_g20619 [Phytophthora fragariae]KAE8990247.1 hypothetical protein PF011_g18434 [Phytophthora fragariae]KAE9089178.1 hypothetical protein PF007_g19687 [Phytophthora fragariae]KAE9089548.1 hypothetical protein PF010_g18946 [Phytophthora fragariae]